MIITGGVQMQHVGTGRQVYLSGSCPDMQCSWGMPPLGKDPTTSALHTLKWVTGRAQVLRRASSAASSGVITGHLRCGTPEAPDHAHLLPACYARDIVPVVCLAFVVACALALARRPAAAQVMRPFVTDFGRLAGCVASPSPARRCCCCRRRCCCSSWCWCYACVILCVRDLVRARTRYDER